MYYIGIDIGKNYHEASIVDSSGKQIGRSFRFASTHRGADKLLSHINQIINDSKDSFLIAEVIRFGKFTTTKPADEDILSMRQLCRHRAVTMSERTEVKLHINTILEQIFPKYEKLFSEV